MVEKDELPSRWMSPGSHDLWGRPEPRGRMYKSVPYEVLPALPLPTSSDPFAWLRLAPTRSVREQLKVGLDGANRLPRPVARMVEEIAAAAKREGLTVPSSYVTFMNDASLHERIPTCTGCYLDVPTTLIALPGGQPGRLLRFMNDQQCAVLWYLHLTVDGACSVVCAEPANDDDDEGEPLDDVKPNLDNVATCALSFEEYVHRFWMENTLWFSLYEKTKAPLTPEQQTYLDAVQNAVPNLSPKY
jgi:hypothetical protein